MGILTSYRTETKVVTNDNKINAKEIQFNYAGINFIEFKGDALIYKIF